MENFDAIKGLNLNEIGKKLKQSLREGKIVDEFGDVQRTYAQLLKSIGFDAGWRVQYPLKDLSNISTHSKKEEFGIYTKDGMCYNYDELIKKFGEELAWDYIDYAIEK